MSSDPGPSRPASPRPPTGPKPATPRPATPRKSHLPIGAGEDMACIVRDARLTLAVALARLQRPVDPASYPHDPIDPFPSEAEQLLFGVRADVDSALRRLSKLAALTSPARQVFDACVRPGGPSQTSWVGPGEEGLLPGPDAGPPACQRPSAAVSPVVGLNGGSAGTQHGPLPGRTVTAGSAAAGGSAQGLGMSAGAGSKPGRSPGRAEDVAAPVAHPGGSPETAAAALGAGAPIRHADGSFSLPVWPGTARAVASIAQQVAAEAQRRSG